MEKYFESSLDKLAQSAKDNKLVVFVGAGISKNSGYPTWKELINKMKLELGIGDCESDYLKVAQFYHNQWGTKQYFDLLNSIFLAKDYKPNAIHKQILDLNPNHIITTNYDELIETQMQKFSKKYHVVKKNNDLAYGSFNKMIIKMHGDIGERNVVLKEDDYSNYSQNFGLIELFIKSLLINHTFLFIGYGLGDQNFNLIFQSIKHELDSDFQRAFFFSSGEELGDLETSYYQNKGINIV